MQKLISQASICMEHVGPFNKARQVSGQGHNVKGKTSSIQLETP